MTSRKGFSLIEILIGISILILLLGLLIMGIGKLRDKSHTTVCLTNLRSIGTAVQLYMNDNHGFLPGPYTSGQKLGYSLSRYSDRYHIPRTLGHYLNLPPATQENQYASSIACPGWRANLGPLAEIDPVLKEPLSTPAYLILGNTLLIDGTRANPWGYSVHGTEPRMYQLIDDPRSQVAIWDIDSKLVSSWKNQIPEFPVHNGKRNALFFDFHVESLLP